MRLLEFQAKELFKEYGMAVPPSSASDTIEDARRDAQSLGYPFMIKFQAPVGGRGKAGGIQKCANADELEVKYPQILNMTSRVKRPGPYCWKRWPT